MSISEPLAVTMMIGTFERFADLAAHVDARDLRAASRRAARGRARRRRTASSASAPSRATCDPEPLPLQPDGEGLDEGLLVLDHQHGRGLVAHRLRLSWWSDRRRRCGRRPGPAGRRSVNVEPSPSLRLDRHLAAVVAGDVADDGQAEAGAAGVPAAGPVDPVEALEDPLEVAGGDADAVVARPPSSAHAVAVGRDADRRRVTTGRARSTSPRCRAGWRRPRPAGGGRPARSGPGGPGSTTIVDAAAARRPGGCGRPRSSSTWCTATGWRTGASPASMRLSSSRSSMVRPTRNASATMRSARRWVTVGVVLGERASRPAGRARRPGSSARG